MLSCRNTLVRIKQWRHCTASSLRRHSGSAGGAHHREGKSQVRPWCAWWVFSRAWFVPTCFVPTFLFCQYVHIFNLKHGWSRTIYYDFLITFNHPKVFSCGEKSLNRLFLQYHAFLLRYSRRNWSNRGSGLQGQSDQQVRILSWDLYVLMEGSNDLKTLEEKKIGEKILQYELI